MDERHLLYILEDLNCKATCKEEIIQCLIDKQYLTYAGSDFENDIICEALESLDWAHICYCLKQRIIQNPDEISHESMSEDEEDEDEEEYLKNESKESDEDD
jgi:hypothetical protein